jgi:hypothetical protein
MFSQIKQLESINDFPKVGLVYYENNGENLLKYYLEKIFKIELGNNIAKENNHTGSIDNHWIINTDYPLRSDSEYNEAYISSVILLVRNPVDVIMSRILKDSFYLEEALNKVDQYIQQWKEFYKYWFGAPVAVHIIRYEDLISNPYDILLDLCKFLLGIKNIDNTKLDYFIKIGLRDPPSKILYAYDIEFTNNTNNLLKKENLETIRNKFYVQLNRVMLKLNYEATDDSDNNADWLMEFNRKSYEKNVEFHELMKNQLLTSSYFSIKIG